LKFAPEILIGSMNQLMTWHSEVRLQPHISHALPFEQSAEGLEMLRKRQSTGKIVIKVSKS
jgi:NADPH2:quinone reductase